MAYGVGRTAYGKWHGAWGRGHGANPLHIAQRITYDAGMNGRGGETEKRVFCHQDTKTPRFNRK